MSFNLRGLVASLEALLANVDTDDFLEMMKAMGINPRSELRYADLADTDMGEADVSGWDFTGADLRNANLSGVQNITEAVFDEETNFVGTRLPEGILPSSLVG